RLDRVLAVDLRRSGQVVDFMLHFEDAHLAVGIRELITVHADAFALDDGFECARHTALNVQRLTEGDVVLAETVALMLPDHRLDGLFQPRPIGGETDRWRTR